MSNESNTSAPAAPKSAPVKGAAKSAPVKGAAKSAPASIHDRAISRARSDLGRLCSANKINLSVTGKGGKKGEEFLKGSAALSGVPDKDKSRIIALAAVIGAYERAAFLAAKAGLWSLWSVHLALVSGGQDRGGESLPARRATKSRFSTFLDIPACSFPLAGKAAGFVPINRR